MPRVLDLAVELQEDPCVTPQEIDDAEQLSKFVEYLDLGLRPRYVLLVEHVP